MTKRNVWSDPKICWGEEALLLDVNVIFEFLRTSSSWNWDTDGVLDCHMWQMRELQH